MSRFSRMSALVVLAIVVTVPLAAQHNHEWLWDRLKIGNETFLKDQDLTFKDANSLRAKDQAPRISIITCSDSRLSPEITAHQNLLDIFVSRTAGNVADKFALASLEYAATPPREWTGLIVVIGHSHCGAIEAALKPGLPGTPNLDALVTRIRTSITSQRYPSPTAAQIAEAAKANARGVARYLTANSAVLRTAVQKDRIKIIPAYYDLETGVLTPLN